ncbi:MAG: DUF2017 family protein [Candidatus Dormibacteria bacterium]
MAEVRKRGARVHLHLDGDERQAILSIVDQLNGELGQRPRTRFIAYDDSTLQEEYGRLVGPDEAQKRDQDITVVRDSLSAGEDVTTLTEAQSMAWVRALNHLRLAAADVAGIESSDWQGQLAASAPPAVRAVLALGYLQEEMVAALEG